MEKGSRGGIIMTPPPKKAKVKKVIFYKQFYCYKGKPHRAFEHSNVGACIVWCPKHGIVTSYTFSKKDSTKQMTRKQYKKFMGI